MQTICESQAAMDIFNMPPARGLSIRDRVLDSLPSGRLFRWKKSSTCKVLQEIKQMVVADILRKQGLPPAVLDALNPPTIGDRVGDILFPESEDVGLVKGLSVVAGTLGIIAAQRTIRRTLDKAMQLEPGDEPCMEPPKKKKYIRRDFDRALRCQMDDFIGDSPRFDSTHFHRAYRINLARFRTIVERLKKYSEFTRRKDATGRFGIDPKVKILASLKQLATGVAAFNLQSEFQIAESTALSALIHFCQAMVIEYALTSKAQF